jgi:hypothetical protein
LACAKAASRNPVRARAPFARVSGALTTNMSEGHPGMIFVFHADLVAPLR